MPNLAQDLAKPNFLRCIHGVGWGGVGSGGVGAKVGVEEGEGGVQVSYSFQFTLSEVVPVLK
jgi:hypothetical protein